MKIKIEGVPTCDDLRKDADGTIWLIKPYPRIEAFLDRLMVRIRPQDLRWRDLRGDERKILFLDDMANVHAGRPAVLLGKGPSLDRVAELDWVPPKGKKTIWAGINEAALGPFPCRYAFAMDGRPLQALEKAFRGTACVHPQHVTYGFQQLLVWEWGKHVPPGFSTAPVALTVLAMMGIRDIDMLGFDGYDGGEEYAPSLGLRPRAEGNYHAINANIDKVAEKFGLNLRFVHRLPRRLDGDLEPA